MLFYERIWQERRENNTYNKLIIRTEQNYGGKIMTLSKAVSQKYAKTIEKCTNEEIYIALLEMVKTMAEDKVSNEGKKKLY